MKELRLLYLYHDMLDLYGDSGNIQVLKYRCEKRNINLIIDNYKMGDETPNFEKYDIVFAGGGADSEQNILSEDLMKYKQAIKCAVNQGVFFLLICGAYQLFGKYYKDLDGNIVPGLEIFNYYTEAVPDPKKRCIGNIVTSVEIAGECTEIIGFENHGGQTYDVATPFGKVLYGNGNKSKDEYEGYFEKNVIATYLHGPLLSKNPKISDYIIKYCLERKYNESIEIEKLDDLFEEECRAQLLEKFIGKNKIAKRIF